MKEIKYAVKYADVQEEASGMPLDLLWGDYLGTASNGK
jgi:hypothetical protein